MRLLKHFWRYLISLFVFWRGYPSPPEAHTEPQKTYLETLKAKRPYTRHRKR